MFLKWFFLIIFTFSISQIQAQTQKKDLSVNLGVGYNFTDNLNRNNWMPRVSVQHKQFELGGFYCFENESSSINFDPTVEYPELHSKIFNLNVFLRYYPLDNININFEFGFFQRLFKVEKYDYITHFVKNPITDLLELRNEKDVFSLGSYFQASFMGLGYSHNLIKGLFIDTQLQYYFGKKRVDVYLDELLTDDANDNNKDDVTKHNFFFFVTLF